MRQRPEREIENACTDLLELDGWRCIKTDLPHLRGLGVQEKGMADRLYIRYRFLETAARRGDEVQAMWIEWKAPKGKPTPHQIDWHKRERALGALTLIAGIDFEASIEG